MKLLTFAHRPEAIAFFDAYGLKSTPYEGLYQTDFGWILITGEGIHEAMSRVSFVLGLHRDIDQVINLGVAGSLVDHLYVSEVYEVRCSFAFDDKPLFKSFPLTGKIDCVTSGKRVLQGEQVTPLLAMGEIVDRELWGVCMAAKVAQISVRSFKFISDRAGSLGACEVVKEMALEASLALLKAFQGAHSVTEPKGLNLNGFYLTFSQTHQIQQLVQKLEIKWQISGDEVLARLEADLIREEKILPKERTKKLIDHLKLALEPWGHKFERKQNSFFKELQGVSVTSPSRYQTEELKAQFQFSSENELMDKLNEFKKISWKDFFDQYKVKDV